MLRIVVGVAVGERLILHSPRPGETPHCAAEAVGSGADRLASVPWISDEAVGVPPHVKAHHHRHYGAGMELQRAGACVSTFTSDDSPACGFELMVRRSRARLVMRRNAAHRPQGVNQSGEIVRPHIEQRTAAQIVVEGRVRMPGFDPRPHHERRAGHGLADRAGVDQAAARSGGRRPETYPARSPRAPRRRARQAEYALAFRHVEPRTAFRNRRVCWPLMALGSPRRGRPE